MASTSTNKQPCLIDRPFLRGARITSATATCDPTNPNLTDLIQLVRVGDLPSEDAALVEDITIVSNEDYPDKSGVRTADIGLYVYAPNQAAQGSAKRISHPSPFPTKHLTKTTLSLSLVLLNTFNACPVRAPVLLHPFNLKF